MIFRPPQGSTLAPMVDSLFDFILWTSVASFALIVLGKLFFLIRFWRKRKDERTTSYITGHTFTESSVAVILVVWVMVIFWWGWGDYLKLRHAPSNALEVYVTGRQWNWSFQYPDGRTSMDDDLHEGKPVLRVPKGEPVKLIMTSEDVLHSFFIPDFRTKQDLVPKSYTHLWFEATQVGFHPVFCAEYCGTEHSSMLAYVQVMEPEDYEEWLLNTKTNAPAASGASAPVAAAAPAAAGKSLAEQGATLYANKGCQGCHSVTDAPGPLAPSFKGIFGKTIELQDGKTATVDENYIRESMMEPNAKIVKGFQPLMPTMKGTLSEEEVNALIAYIKSLNTEGAKP